MSNAQPPSITLVIPSFNRPDYLVRQIEFWKNEPVKIVILDGSEHPLVYDFPINVSYKHLTIGLFDRFMKARDFIDTPYVSVLGDDDFFLPSGLFACLEELIKLPDYVSCIGRSVGFYFNGDCIKTSAIYMGLKNVDYNSISPEDRLKRHMNPYVPSCFYAVTSSDIWKKAISLSCENNYSSVYTSEIIFEMAISIYGKSKVIPELMWLRSFENEPISISSFNRKLRFHEWYLNKDFESESNSLVEKLATELEMKNNLTKDASKEIIIEAIGDYISFCKRPLVKRIISKIRSKMGVKVLAWENHQVTINKLTREGVKVATKEFVDILDLVSRFHLSR